MAALQVLIYKTAENYLEKRKPHRAMHFEHIKKYNQEGNIILGGAMGDPVDSAMIVFQNVEQDIIEQFAQTDPYIINGVITSWEIKVWHEVIGNVNT